MPSAAGAVLFAILLWTLGAALAWWLCVLAVRACRWAYSGWQSRRDTRRISSSAYERVQARRSRVKP